VLPHALPLADGAATQDDPDDDDVEFVVTFPQPVADDAGPDPHPPNDAFDVCVTAPQAVFDGSDGPPHPAFAADVSVPTAEDEFPAPHTPPRAYDVTPPHAAADVGADALVTPEERAVPWERSPSRLGVNFSSPKISCFLSDSPEMFDKKLLTKCETEIQE
jgi:hypothetical protein